MKYHLVRSDFVRFDATLPFKIEEHKAGVNKPFWGSRDHAGVGRPTGTSMEDRDNEALAPSGSRVHRDRFRELLHPAARGGRRSLAGARDRLIAGDVDWDHRHGPPRA